MGTAKESKKRLRDLKEGKPFRDPETKKVEVTPDKKGKITPLDLFDPEKLPEPKKKPTKKTR